jgi:hypothetical protein
MISQKLWHHFSECFIKLFLNHVTRFHECTCPYLACVLFSMLFAFQSQMSNVYYKHNYSFEISSSLSFSLSLILSVLNSGPHAFYAGALPFEQP